MAKEAKLAMRLPMETRVALERAAKEELRPLASMAEKIITDFLKEKGYLKK